VTPPRILPLALALVAVAPATAAAQNASVSKTTPEIVYQGTDGVDDITVLLNNPPAIIFQAGAPTLMDAGANCSGVVGQEHTRVGCQPGGATIDLAGGDDKVLGGSDGHGMNFNGGPGNDTLNPSSSAINTVNGGPGADSIMAGGLNRDFVDGGDGNDTIRYPRGGDDVRGGAGADLLVIAGPAPYTVSLDDAENDGDGSGAANIHSDVEQVTGGAEADTFTGSDAPNTLTGGQGDDTLDGAGGADTIAGGEGGDTISARDGVADAIDCGVGDDTAAVDALDTVAGCETVLRPADDTPAAARTPVSGLPPTGRVTVTQIAAPVRNRWLVGRRATKVTALSVSGAPAGGRVSVTCAGQGCPFGKRSRQVPRNGKAGFTAALQGRALRPGVVLEIRITAAGAIGKVVRYTVRKGKLPKPMTLCLAPGAAKPAARC